MAELQDRLRSALGTAYRIERELGGGGMSRVFLAHEVRLGRSVVVKVLPPEMAAGVNVDRFEREIHLAAKLQHPHIVPLLTAGSSGDLLYYVMPHIEGQSLRTRLAHERELPIGEALRILRDVCDALAHAHAQGIVHRDIKPDNVLLSGKHALVTDFGVAKAVTQSTGGMLTSLGVALGTPAYMAPEQAAGDPNLDHRADLYAVGALAYEMLAGQPPFSGMSPQALMAAHVTSTVEPVTKHRESVPPALADLVMRCLAKRPADRWQSANEILAELEQMVTPTGGITPTGGGSAPYAAAAAAARAHPIRVAGLYVVASVAVLGIVYVTVDQLGLPGWVMPATAALLAAGLPLMVLTGLSERRRALARTTGPATAPTADGLHRWLTWRKALTGGAAAFIALGLAAGVYSGMRALGIGPVGTLVASGVLEKRGRLVLADFENRTRDTALGPSLTEALRVDLAQSPALRLLDGAAVAQALGRMGRKPGTPLDLVLARELAQREGAKAVVRGQVDPVGRGYVLSAELVSAADGAVLVALRENAQDDGAIIDAVDRLSKRLRERIGESLKTIRASEPLEQFTTASLEALRTYSQAVRANDAGEVDRATALLEEAIALDTTFAMGYRKLAVILSNTGAARSRTAAAAAKAFRYRDRLTPIERYLAEAYYYTVAEYDPPKVENAYRSVLDVDPENSVALNNLALRLNEGRRFAEAESLTLRGIAVAPNQWTLYVNAFRAQVGQGNLAAATRTGAWVTERAPRNPIGLMLRARLAEARREFDSSEAYVRELGQMRRDVFWQAATEHTLAMLSLVRGRLAEAESHARRGMAVDEQRGMAAAYLTNVALLALIDLRFRNAVEAGRRKLDDALRRHPLSSIPAEDRPYLSLAWCYAEAGRPDRARQLLAEYDATVPEVVRRGEQFRHGAGASLALAEGRVRDAIQGYRAWYSEDDCSTCGLFDLARAYERAGERDSALAVYERAVTTPGWERMFHEALTLGPTYKRLGELYEERGQLDKARDYYGRLVDLWRNADTELQPIVRDVKQRLAGLIRERGNGKTRNVTSGHVTFPVSPFPFPATTSRASPRTSRRAPARPRSTPQRSGAFSVRETLPAAPLWGPARAAPVSPPSAR
jgi:tetratricopeptide (TPR) repeat protein